jgi:molecular chaperone DnaJ
MATRSTKKDYYEVLGIERTAPAESIKKAYRKLALQYHPDRNKGNPDAESRFKEAAEAYAVLSDPQKRSQYDQFGHSLGGAGFQGFQGYEDAFRGFGDIFGDVFEDFFGGGAGQGGSRVGIRGSDLEYPLTISLEEAASGKEVQIEFVRQESCEHCAGSGAEKGSKKKFCAECGGHGEVRVSQGFFTFRRTCPRCSGEGELIEKPCRVCSGSGRERKKRKLSLKIPAGISDGSQLKVSGEGESGAKGGSRGNLYVYIHVKEHSFFKRVGNDLACDVKIDFHVAALGGEIEVPTLAGKVRLKIPAGTQPGRVFRLREKGFKDLRSYGVGDQLVHVTVEVPERLTAQEKKILEEFAKLQGNGKKKKKFFSA